MEKARRALSGVLANARFVVEVADARAPVSTRNPELIKMAESRPRLLVLAKSDLADPGATQTWLSRLEEEGERALAVSLLDAETPRVIAKALRALVGEQMRDPAAGLRSIKGLALPKVGRQKARGLVVGMPNTGKSSLIRSLGGNAERANRPGVTRGVQEYSIGGDLALFDSPGMMWPRAFTDLPALHLAWLGCVGPAAYDGYEAGRALVQYLCREEPGRIAARYGVTEEESEDPDEILREIAVRRGLYRGAEPDSGNAANVLMSEFRRGLLGRMSLERAG